MTRVLLLSGGLDSQVLAATHSFDRYIYYDYGNKNKEMELSKINIPNLEVIKIDDMERLESGFFVARNLKFILKTRDIIKGDMAVYIGCNLDDTFSDNTPSFMSRLEDILNLSYIDKTKIVLPLRDKNKIEIIEIADNIGLDYWYCDSPGPLPCGVCHSCLTHNYQSSFNPGRKDNFYKG